MFHLQRNHFLGSTFLSRVHGRFLSSASNPLKHDNTAVTKEETLAPWQKWINFDSPFKDQTDELNRKRHYFWRVDAKGRMFRRELHVPNETFGELRAPKAKDLLLAAVRRNTTGNYLTNEEEKDKFPFLAMRLHEHNFMQCEDLSPVVFHDIVDAMDTSICSLNALDSAGTHFLKFGADLKHPFHADQLLLSRSGKLYHPYRRSEVINLHLPKASQIQQARVDADEEQEETILGLLESALAQKLLESIEASDQAGETTMTLNYQGQKHSLKCLED